MVLNQAILTADNPVADVLFGVDNTFLTRALDADLFVPYDAPGVDGVPEELQLDPEHRVTPIDYGDVCVNYDIAALAAAGVEPPQTLDDLIDPAYRGMLAVEDPATSSPGLAFLLGTIAQYGVDGWQRLVGGARHQRRAGDLGLGGGLQRRFHRHRATPATGRWWCRTPALPRPRCTSPRSHRRKRPPRR